MKKKIFGFAAAGLLTVGLAACGNSDSKGASSKSDDTTLKSRRITNTSCRNLGTRPTAIERRRH